jgi:hypothetical protein
LKLTYQPMSEGLSYLRALDDPMSVAGH